MFNIFNLSTQKLVADEDGVAKVYATGALAAQVAKNLAETTGDKFQPRKAIADDSWKAREQARLDSGEYRRACPELEAVFLPEHFAHMSKKKPGEIAYTKDAAKGADDKQSIISIPAYLDAFAPSLSTEERDSIIAAQSAIDTTEFATVLFATTPDEIEAVYTNYASQPSCGSRSMPDESCMRYDADHFRTGGVHPVRIYGAGDLAIAYLTNDDGQTRARALCWPAKKVYSRVYGPNDELHRHLKALGYTKSGGYYGEGGPTLEGAKLKRIEKKYDSDCLIAPYIDEGYLRDCGSYLEFSYDDDDLDASETDGTLKLRSEPEFTCENCESECDEDDTHIVYTRTNSRGAQHWCSHCYENSTFYCDGDGETYADFVDNTTLANGETVNDGYLDRHCERCEKTDEWYVAGDMNDVIIDEFGNTARWCDSACDDYATRNANGEWISDDVEQTEYVTVLETESSDEETESAFPCDLDSVAFKCAVDGRYYALDLRHPENECVAICNYSPTAPYHCQDENQLSLPLAA